MEEIIFKVLEISKSECNCMHVLCVHVRVYVNMFAHMFNKFSVRMIVCAVACE